jgi:hypothetical protein
MRRLVFIAIGAFFVLVAGLPLQPMFVVRAVPEGEQLAMYGKPSVVRIVDGAPGTVLFQLPEGFPLWIVAVALIVLVFIVVIIGVGLAIFFMARRRGKSKRASAAGFPGMATDSPASLRPSPAPASHSPSPANYSPSPLASKASPPSSAQEVEADVDQGMTVDLSRTVAIIPDSDTAPISYGAIKFVSGSLAGQQFPIEPEGTYVGRDASLTQIVIADPRISKRHLWIGVREGRVVITDQGSRNGTFINDPKSQRVIEAPLNPGDTVILGESDVARFEYQD